MEEINIKDFLQYLRKYTAVIILLSILFVLGIYVYDKHIKTPMYSTSTTIVLVKNDDEKSYSVADSNTITQNDIILNQKLVATYRKIIKSRLVLQQVISNLSLDYSYDKLYSEIDVQAEEDTEILRITVTDANPEIAVEIANKLVEIFDKEVKQIYKINNVSVIDRAVVRNSPSNNTLLRDVVLALFVAVVGSTVIVFVVFYFDDTLKFNDNIEKDIDMPVVGKVFKDDTKIELVVDKKPKAVTSESIRTLRTNLQFASVDKELKTLLITSTVPGEGKSFISSNLGISFAQAGKKVLIIDCDLRKGRQHKIFKVTNKKGLSTLLIGNIKDFAEYISETNVENLSVIPRGIFPPNPSELLSSKRMELLLETLKKYFDIIILDGAPSSGLSDSLILSSIVDETLIVSAVNYTPITELKNVKKSLENVGAHIAGCVVNNISTKRGSYGGYYYYQYSYGEEKKK